MSRKHFDTLDPLQRSGPPPELKQICCLPVLSKGPHKDPDSSNAVPVTDLTPLCREPQSRPRCPRCADLEAAALLPSCPFFCIPWMSVYTVDRQTDMHVEIRACFFELGPSQTKCAHCIVLIDGRRASLSSAAVTEFILKPAQLFVLVTICVETTNPQLPHPPAMSRRTNAV